MSTVPARVAAAAAQADETLAALAAAANDPTPPAAVAPPADPPPPAAPPAPSVTPTSLEVEMQRVQQQLATQTGRVEALMLQNTQLQTQLAKFAERAPEPPAPATPPAPLSLISEKERSEFGEETIDVMVRAAKQTLGPLIDQLSTRIAQLEGRLGRTAEQVQTVTQTTQQSAQERYFSTLDAKIPGWEEVNNDPGFLRWLQNREQFSKKAYNELLVSAHEGLDAATVINIFRAYKPEKWPEAPPTAAPDGNPPPSQPARIDPSTLAAPATNAPAAPPTNQPQGQLWKQSEVDALYEDHRKGRITPQVFQQREAAYMKALAEGRVVANQ